MDVVPKLDEEAEEIRRAQGIFARNYLANLYRYSFRDYLNLVTKRGRRRLKRVFRARMPAHEVRPLVGEAIWNSYYQVYHRP